MGDDKLGLNLLYVTIDLTTVSSVGNRTSTCLMCDSSLIKTVIVLLNFAFKCRILNETSAIALVQTGMQANQLARVIDYAGNITNFTENCARLKRDVFFNFVFVIKKVYQENIPFGKTILIKHIFIKGIIGKTNCYWHVCFFYLY